MAVCPFAAYKAEIDPIFDSKVLNPRPFSQVVPSEMHCANVTLMTCPINTPYWSHALIALCARRQCSETRLSHCFFVLQFLRHCCIPSGNSGREEALISLQYAAYKRWTRLPCSFEVFGEEASDGLTEGGGGEGAIA